jgi:biopolymer transport protein ExbD
VDSAFTYKSDCPLYGPQSVLQTRLTLSREGQTLGSSDGLHYIFIAFFDAAKQGNYRLDVDVLSDASCLNGGHPRILVETGSRFYEDLYEKLRWFSFLPIVGGLGLLLHTAIAVLRKRTTKTMPAIFQGSIPEHRWLRRYSPVQRLSGLPSFGLVCATILSVVVVMAILVNYDNRRPSRGIRASVRRECQKAKGSMSTPPPIVRVQGEGPDSPTRLYLNSKFVPGDDFESALKEDLGRRPDWVVCVEADPNLSWAQVVSTIDTIRGLQANVVLLTSETTQMSGSHRINRHLRQH